MNIRQEIRYLKDLGRMVWYTACDWRETRRIHKQLAEDESLAELRETLTDIRACDACTESERCAYHQHLLEEIVYEKEHEKLL